MAKRLSLDLGSRFKRNSLDMTDPTRLKKTSLDMTGSRTKKTSLDLGERSKKTSRGDSPIVLTTITNEHIIPLDVLCERLGTNMDSGMSDNDAKHKLRIIGKNKFERPKRRFMFDFNGFKVQRQDFSKSEWKRIFGHQIPDEVTVYRDSKRKQISGKHLVRGDIIELQKNDIVPADIRIIESCDVIVDNRIITGDFHEVRNHNDMSNDCLRSPNMVFACTRILTGSCLGIVLRTGEETVFGTLKNFAEKVKIEKARRKHSFE
uniref:Uncharacterized protein n=1 Tax=Clytia hemisphaerica TaxID=252671 RepID=A0A7M5V1J5_9CNID